MNGSIKKETTNYYCYRSFTPSYTVALVPFADLCIMLSGALTLGIMGTLAKYTSRAKFLIHSGRLEVRLIPP